MQLNDETSLCLVNNAKYFNKKKIFIFFIFIRKLFPDWCWEHLYVLKENLQRNLMQRQIRSLLKTNILQQDKFQWQKYFKNCSAYKRLSIYGKCLATKRKIQLENVSFAHFFSFVNMIYRLVFSIRFLFQLWQSFFIATHSLQ